MPKMRPLYKWIGDPITMLAGSTLSSDGTALTSDDDGKGIPIKGSDGVLFILGYGATDADAAFEIQIQYSSTGYATDAATSNAGMTCSDAVFTTAVHVSGGVTLMEFDVSAKGLADSAGKLFAIIAAAETGTASPQLIGIPYGGTRTHPATNANTVLFANATT